MVTINATLIWTLTAIQVADALGRDNIRAVGGCVRDVLLERPIQDIDFATTLLPDEVITRCEKADIVVKRTGYEHGTVTAIVNGHAYQITTLRADVETDGRHAKVAYSTKWHEDAERRDFTVNALYCDVEGVVYDETGHGISDIKARYLTFIGNPQARIREDYLRVLRLFRFYAQLQNFTIDQESLNACAGQGDGLRALSIERVTEECVKLLLGGNASQSIALYQDSNIDSLDFELSAIADLGPLEQIGKKQPMLPVLIYLAFGERYEDCLRLPNSVIKTIEVLKSQNMSVSWQEVAYRFGIEVAVNFFLFRCVRLNISFAQSDIDTVWHYKPPQSPVNSQEFIANGLEGRALGKAIKEAEDAWIAQHFAQYQ